MATIFSQNRCSNTVPVRSIPQDTGNMNPIATTAIPVIVAQNASEIWVWNTSPTINSHPESSSLPMELSLPCSALHTLSQITAHCSQKNHKQNSSQKQDCHEEVQHWKAMHPCSFHFHPCIPPIVATVFYCTQAVTSQELYTFCDGPDFDSLRSIKSSFDMIRL